MVRTAHFYVNARTMQLAMGSRGLARAEPVSPEPRVLEPVRTEPSANTAASDADAATTGRVTTCRVPASAPTGSRAARAIKCAPEAGTARTAQKSARAAAISATP